MDGSMTPPDDPDQEIIKNLEASPDSLRQMLELGKFN
jgi:hypothetical protein